MHRKLPVAKFYCSRCKGTTEWILSSFPNGSGYMCAGDERHPERGKHACGNVLMIEDVKSTPIATEDRL